MDGFEKMQFQETKESMLAVVPKLLFDFKQRLSQAGFTEPQAFQLTRDYHTALVSSSLQAEAIKNGIVQANKPPKEDWEGGAE